MGIQRLRVQGFRSLKDVSWEPSALNVVIGPNGTGKSNLLRCLAMLSHSAGATLGDEILAAGGIAPLLWDREATEIRWEVKTDPAFPGKDLIKEALTYELVLQQLGGASAFRVEHELLGNYYLKDIGQKPSPMKFLERSPGRAVTFDLTNRELVAHEGTVPDDQTLLSLVAGPFSNPVVTGFKKKLSSWSIYHDLQVHQSAPLRRATVARRETTLSPDGQNLIPVLHTLYTGDREFKRAVDAAMRAAFGPEYEELVFPPAADQQVQLRVQWRCLRTQQSAADLSDGTIRFLLLLAILGNPEPGDLIAIDEPETGLHPSMLPIVAELAGQAATKTQIIITTHSPEMLDAFRDVIPTTTVARWTEGRTELPIVEGEELLRWLKDYSLGALARSGELEGLA